MDYIDKQFAKRGYKLVCQNEYGAYYERKDNKFNYTSELDIIAKANGKHLVQCYDAQVVYGHPEKDSNNYRVMNEVDGIDASLSFWIWLKFHQLKRKYKWDKVKKHD